MAEMAVLEELAAAVVVVVPTLPVTVTVALVELVVSFFTTNT